MDFDEDEIEVFVALVRALEQQAQGESQVAVHEAGTGAELLKAIGRNPACARWRPTRYCSPFWP